MSKVYSFRLSNDNPREAQAREVIEAWVEEGYSLRLLVTDALVNFRKQSYKTSVMDEILRQLDNIQDMLDRGQMATNINGNPTNHSLSSGFVEAVKMNIKSGIRS